MPGEPLRRIGLGVIEDRDAVVADQVSAAAYIPLPLRKRLPETKKHDRAEPALLNIGEQQRIAAAGSGKNLARRIVGELFEIALKPHGDIGLGPVIDVHRVLDPAVGRVDFVEAEIRVSKIGNAQPVHLQSR